MSTIVAIGSEGNVTLPSGFNATLNAWSCNITRATSNVTGYSNNGGTTRVASSVLDITGSAGGMPNYGSASTDPLSQFATSATGGTVTLLVVGAVSSECSISFNAVFNSISIGSTQDGEATVSFNFEAASESGPTFTWYEV